MYSLHLWLLTRILYIQALHLNNKALHTELAGSKIRNDDQFFSLKTKENTKKLYCTLTTIILRHYMAYIILDK